MSNEKSKIFVDGLAAESIDIENMTADEIAIMRRDVSVYIEKIILDKNLKDIGKAANPIPTDEIGALLSTPDDLLSQSLKVVKGFGKKVMLPWNIYSIYKTIEERRENADEIMKVLEWGDYRIRKLGEETPGSAFNTNPLPSDIGAMEEIVQFPKSGFDRDDYSRAAERYKGLTFPNERLLNAFIAADLSRDAAERVMKLGEADRNWIETFYAGNPSKEAAREQIEWVLSRPKAEPYEGDIPGRLSDYFDAPFDPNRPLNDFWYAEAEREFARASVAKDALRLITSRNYFANE